jgi:hypothetical protein
VVRENTPGEVIPGAASMGGGGGTAVAASNGERA